MHKQPLNPADPLQEAHMKRNLKFLLMPHFLFRAFVNFKNNKRTHLYGNEHKVTYNQILAGRVPQILLNREKGYTDLITLIETAYVGKYKQATIYMRTPGTNEFDTICRSYDSNGIRDMNDPVLSDEQKQLTLYYTIESGRVFILTEPVPQPDFKNIINQKLNNK